MIIEKSGEVCCAHCNCMAELGEACSHIAAVLFYEWVLPSYLKNVEYLPVSDMSILARIQYHWVSVVGTRYT